MFRNYLAAALRNLLRSRAVTLINITGLVVGFAAALLIALYVRFEHGYENFIPGYEEVYRLSMDVRTTDTGLEHMDESTHRAAAALELDFPGIERVARLKERWHPVSTGDRDFTEQAFEADPDFFRVIPVPAVAGDLARALDQPNSIAISRAMARKYFGRDDPIGETLTYDRLVPMRVTAVFEDLPANSHFNFKLVNTPASGSVLLRSDVKVSEEQPGMRVHTYFRLRPGADAENIRSQLPQFGEKLWPGVPSTDLQFQILPIADIHLSQEVKRSLKPRGNPRALRALTLVGLITLLIAVINFVNLTTARAAQRAVEVGVRKLVGASRGALTLQFMAESLLLVAIAMVLAISLVELALPAFRALLDPGDNAALPSIMFDYWKSPSLLVSLAGATLLIGAAAAFYPAMVLSSFRPVAVLKGGTLQGARGLRVREVLVVLQVALLIGLIFATSVIFRQTHYALHAAMRVDTDQVVIYTLDSEASLTAKPAQRFRDAVAAIPGVLETTGSLSVPTNGNIPNVPLATLSGGTTILNACPVDRNFFDFYRVRLLAGRTFSRDLETDHFALAESARPLSVVINESAARSLGYTTNESAVGKALRIMQWPPQAPPPPNPVTIAGVVADFPVNSLRREIEPAVYFVFEPLLSILSIRIAGGSIPETFAAIGAAWKKSGQPRAQEGWFLDGYYRTLHADIILQQKLLGLFTGCAAFLAILSLFGLSIYMTQQRTKEIGIRKVMGAGTPDIMALLLWAFSKPVLWASVIVWPAAAWIMNRWLEGFAYHVTLGWWWLPAGSLIALAIATLTVSAHSYAAARAEPTRALRYE
jgi:putative ABC transport system permease protein